MYTQHLGAEQVYSAWIIQQSQPDKLQSGKTNVKNQIRY